MGLSTKFDYRFDPFTEQDQAVDISNEEKTVPNNTPYYVDLEEVPREDSPSTITAYDVTAGLTLSEVSAAPAANEFQADYKYKTGKVRFNSVQAGHNIRFAYKGTGHVIAATIINMLSDWLGKNYTKADDHDHDGTDSKLVASAGGAAGGVLTGTYPNPGHATTVPVNIQVFTSSGTWIKPANVSKVYVKVWGGGGGGENTAGEGSGGGGGYAEGLISVSGNVTVTVGAGGGGQVNGGTSSFAGDTTIQAVGGNAGTQFGGGAGGNSSGGAVNLSGGNGEMDYPGGWGALGGQGGTRQGAAGKIPGGGGASSGANGAAGLVIVMY